MNTMEIRQITEREFIYSAKGIGDYCTYDDTKNAIAAVFKAIRKVAPEKSDAFKELLPESIRPMWDQAEPLESPLTSVIELIQYYASFSTKRAAEIALITFFATLREKYRAYIDQWENIIPDETKSYWEKSQTIGDGLDAKQCL